MPVQIKLECMTSIVRNPSITFFSRVAIAYIKALLQLNETMVGGGHPNKNEPTDWSPLSPLFLHMRMCIYNTCIYAFIPKYIFLRASIISVVHPQNSEEIYGLPKFLFLMLPTNKATKSLKNYKIIWQTPINIDHSHHLVSNF